MDEKIRIMVDAAILMENSFDGRQVCASDLLPLARLAGPLAREVERLTAELEEARLTLAAEQGRAEGAPSEGWEFDDGWRRIDALADRYVCLIADSDPACRWCATVITGPEDASIEQEIWAPTARAAMLAADAAK